MFILALCEDLGQVSLVSPEAGPRQNHTSWSVGLGSPSLWNQYFLLSRKYSIMAARMNRDRLGLWVYRGRAHESNPSSHDCYIAHALKMMCPAQLAVITWLRQHLWGFASVQSLSSPPFSILYSLEVTAHSPYLQGRELYALP